MRIDVLNKINKNCLFSSPFPYIYIKNCLPEDIYNELDKTYPSDQEIIRNQKKEMKIKQNQRIDLNASQFINSKENFSTIWNDFINYHTSATFFNKISNIFNPYFEKYFDEKSSFLKQKHKVGIRYTDNDVHSISVDCQIGINTPTKKKSSVRGPHIDSPQQLFGGFLYFKNKNSKVKGGDLDIYEWIPGKKKSLTGSNVSFKKIKKVLTIKYEANSLFLLLNNLDAIHGVSERNTSTSSRRLVNIIGEVYNEFPDGLFDIPQTKKGILKNSLRTISKNFKRLNS